MAYLATYLTDDEKKKAEEAKGGTTPRATSGVVDATTPTGPTPTGGAPAAAPEQKAPGTGFVNLQQYLDMNQGEGARLAGAATKGLTSQVDSFAKEAAKTTNTGYDQIKAGAGDAEAKKVIQGVVSDASAAQDIATSFLGKGYEGPVAGDLTADLAATKNDLTGKLSTVDNAENVQSSLASTYGNKGAYTGGFGLLDSFLVGGTQSGRDKLAEVKGKTAVVDKELSGAQSALTAAEEAAKQKLEKNKQAVINTAKQSQNNLLGSLEKKAAKLTGTVDPNAKGAKAASIGDVATDEQKADLDALTAILNGDGIDYAATFNKGSIPTPDTPSGEDVPPPPASGEIVAPPPPPPGSGSLPPALKANSDALGAAAKAGADISDAVKKINEPNVETFEALGNFKNNPTPETALELLKKSGLAPFVTAYNSLQVANDLVHQLDGRITKELNKAFPGVGAGLGTTLDASKGPLLDLLAPKLPNAKDIKIPQADLPTDVKVPNVAKNIKAPPLKTKQPLKMGSGADILKKAAAAKDAKTPKLPKVPSWAPKGADVNLFDSNGKLVGDANKLVAGLNPAGIVDLLKNAPDVFAGSIRDAVSEAAKSMSQMELNQLDRKLKGAGIGGSVAKAVAGVVSGIKANSDAAKAAGKAASDAEAAAQKAATDAANAAKHAGGVVADEVKKLGGKVASEGKKLVSKVPPLKKPKPKWK